MTASNPSVVSTTWINLDVKSVRALLIALNSALSSFAAFDALSNSSDVAIIYVIW